MFVIASIGNCITLTRSEDINVETNEDAISIVSGDGTVNRYDAFLPGNQFPPTSFNSNNVAITFTS